MLVQELHIRFLQGLNKIASYQDVTFTEDEIDMYLTRGQLGVIESQWKLHGNKIDKNSEDFSNILTKNRVLDCYVIKEPHHLFEPHVNTFYFQLPGNHLYTVNVKPDIDAGNKCNPLSGNNITDSNVDKFISIVPMNKDMFATLNSYTIKINYDQSGTPITLFDSSDYNWTIESWNDAYHVVNHILDFLNRENRLDITTASAIRNNPADTFLLDEFLNLEVYWERFDDLYYPNSFIFVSDDETYASGKFMELEINSGGASYSVTPTDSNYYIINDYRSRGIFNAVQYTTRNVNLANIPFEGTGIGRNIDIKKTYEYIDSPIDKPSKDRPLYNRTNNNIILYVADNVSINKVYLDYIRIPRPINLRSGWNSELNEALHQNIVDRAVDIAALEMQYQDMQAKAISTQLEP